MLDKSLNYLIPNKVHDLKRIGNNRDAGYVVSNLALNNCNFLISFGMAENFSLEEDFIKLNASNKIHIYDHTVNLFYFIKRIYKSIKRLFYFKSSVSNIFSKIKDLRNYNKILKNNQIKHFKEKIGFSGDVEVTSLSEIIERTSKEDKIFLKSDIEGDEFQFLKDIDKQVLKIHLMVIEFHFLDKNRSQFRDIIKQLKKDFYLIHLHGNNYSNYCEDGLPKVLEISFLNKKYYDVKDDEYNLSFPIDNLDFPNIENEKDLNFSFQI